ncbi:MAG: hypothetical protein KKC66_01645 [Candidatus Omnitrophica bacterium]|nr:hypothetical protein [Candidatus Omnitrophota bacterium]MBU1932592.1 hypothetical protein [Candidatus Omnitrophota bacterium]
MSQIIIGILLVAFCAVGAIFGSMMIKNGMQRIKEQPLAYQDSHPQQKIQNNTKIARVKIKRIIEDANSWLKKEIEKDKEEKEKIISGFNQRGTLYSGMHVAEHMKRVDNFIKSCNDYIEKIDREIEDLLMPIGEQSFEDVNWLKEEYQEYSKFIQYSRKVKDTIKKENNELCIRFCDEPTFNKILQANPYLE